MTNKLVYRNGPFFVVERALSDGSFVFDVCNESETIAWPMDCESACKECDEYAAVDKAYKRIGLTKRRKP